MGRSGGIVFLIAAVVLTYGLLLLAQQSFALGSFLASVASSTPPSTSSAASTLTGIVTAGVAALYVVGVAVLLVGPGNLLMYLQKSRSGGEYAGGGLLVAGRIVLAIAVWATASYLVTVSNSIKPSSSSSSTPSVTFSNLIFSAEFIIIYIIVGVALGIVGRVLLTRPRTLEHQVPRSDRYERLSRYTGYASTGLYVIGVILVVLIAFTYFTGGVSFISSQSKANLFGYGVIFLSLGVILSGFRDMFHAFAFAEQPMPPAAAPPPAPAPMTTP